MYRTMRERLRASGTVGVRRIYNYNRKYENEMIMRAQLAIGRYRGLWRDHRKIWTLYKPRTRFERYLGGQYTAFVCGAFWLEMAQEKMSQTVQLVQRGIYYGDFFCWNFCGFPHFSQHDFKTWKKHPGISKMLLWKSCYFFFASFKRSMAISISSVWYP